MERKTFEELKKDLGAVVEVSNISLGRAAAANQFSIICENGSVFKSYRSIIAVRVNGKLYLSKEHEYSTATSRYATKWTGLDLNARRKAIKNGEVGLLIKEYERNLPEEQ